MSAPTKGVVLIKVISASNLKAVDKNGTSDSFVIISRKGRRKQEKTKVIKKTTNPVWNEVVRIKVTGQDVLQFSCMHWNQFSMNVSLGKAKIPVAVILLSPPETPIEYSLDLEEGNGAKLNVKIVFMLPSREAELSGKSLNSLSEYHFNKPSTPVIRPKKESNKHLTYKNYVPQQGIFFRDVVTRESQWNSLALNLLSAPPEKNWKALGKQLGLSEQDLNSIETKLQPNEYVKEILNDWQNGKFATVDIMLFALQDLDNFTVYRELVSWLDASKAGTTQDENTELQMIPSSQLDVGEVIGQGTYAQVYRGAWFGVPVALKEVKLKQQSAQGNFMTEIAVLANCQSPNLVRLYGLCVEKQVLMVLENMPNSSLYSLLHEEFDELPWKERYHIAIGIARGIHYLHTNNIIHGSLNSSNVLLDEDNNPKLTDFGLLKTKEALKNNTGLGVRWVAPEIIRKESQHTKFSDIYSLGMILWELSSLEIPFSAESDDSVADWIKKGHKETVPPICPKQFKSAILNCWKDPTERVSAEVLYHYLWNADEPMPDEQIPKQTITDALYKFLSEREEFEEEEEEEPAKPSLAQALLKSMREEAPAASPATVATQQGALLKSAPNQKHEVLSTTTGATALQQQVPKRAVPRKPSGSNLSNPKKWNLLLMAILSAVVIALIAVVVKVWVMPDTPVQPQSFLESMLGKIRK